MSSRRGRRSFSQRLAERRADKEFGKRIRKMVPQVRDLDAEPKDVIQEIERQHQFTIPELALALRKAGSKKGREDAFLKLARTVVGHEVAEDETIHPRYAQINPADAKMLEDEGHELIAFIDLLLNLDVDSDQFILGYDEFEAKLLDHNIREEKEHETLRAEAKDDATLRKVLKCLREDFLQIQHEVIEELKKEA